MRRQKRAIGRKITTEEGFFIINKDFERFLVNGQVMSRGGVAGPLPDFAVIELDSNAIFWWRNREALSYSPGVEFSVSPWYWSLIYWGLVCEIEQILWRSKRDLKRSRSADDRRENKRSKGNSYHRDKSLTSKSDNGARTISHPPPPPRNVDNTGEGATLKNNSYQRRGGTSHSGSESGIFPPLFSSPRTWQDVLNEGLEWHRRCKTRMEAREKVRPTGPFRRFARPDKLGEDDVILAIATFWEALRRDGQLFAFAGVDFFGQTNSGNGDFQLRTQGVVGAPEKFIMPLLLHPHKNKGAKAADKTEQLGHLVLFTAEWSADRQKIRLDLSDSLQKRSGVFKKDMIERAKELITGSRWPYDQAKQPAPGFFSAVSSLASPQQEGTNTCGFYMILNAWCIMLGIPISRTEKRRVRTKDFKLFLRDGQEIINLALIGCMDAITVQAFLNVWGYSQEQILEEAVARNVTAVRMDMEILHRALYQQAVLEGRGYKPSRKEVTDLIQVTGLKGKVTFEELQAKLIEEEGDGNRAVARLLSPSPVESPLVSPAANARRAKAKTEVEEEKAGSLSPGEQLKKAIELSMQPSSPAPGRDMESIEEGSLRKSTPPMKKPSPETSPSSKKSASSENPTLLKPKKK